MSLHLQDLDATTRAQMTLELDADLRENTLYLSPRLSEIGVRDYPALLREAIEKHADTWLAAQLRLNNRLRDSETRHLKNGRVIEAKVPDTAAETLAEGEFNRFYIRGVCLRAQQDGVNIEVYRAKQVETPRAESEAMIGRQLDPSSVLTDLRSRPGVDTALGLPPGPNSGLSARLPRPQ